MTSPSPAPQLKWRVGCRTWRTTPAARAATTISAGRGRRQSRWCAFHPDNPLVIVGGATTHARTRTSRRPRARIPRGAVSTSSTPTMARSSRPRLGRTGSIARSVAGDVTLVDRDFDGYVDHGYFADVGGALLPDRFLRPAARDAPAGRMDAHQARADRGCRQEVPVRAGALRPRAASSSPLARATANGRSHTTTPTSSRCRTAPTCSWTRSRPPGCRGPGQYVADGQLLPGPLPPRR